MRELCSFITILGTVTVQTCPRWTSAEAVSHQRRHSAQDQLSDAGQAESWSPWEAEGRQTWSNVAHWLWEHSQTDGHYAAQVTCHCLLVFDAFQYCTFGPILYSVKATTGFHLCNLVFKVRHTHGNDFFHINVASLCSVQQQKYLNTKSEN